MTRHKAIVVGAGPGGLAAAAALEAKGVPTLVLEKSDTVGASWRGHYDRLRLHTPARLSGLPGLPFPRRYGRWVARDDVIEYLETYVRYHGLDVRTGVEVAQVDQDGDVTGGWRVSTADGETYETEHLVVATGYNHTPTQPTWPGLETFTGEVLHASTYRNGAPFAGQKVLVVGIGNTGAEIATDLADHGAAEVSIAVRTPPHILRRSRLGISAQMNGIMIRHLPTALVDRMADYQAKVEIPDLSDVGLPWPSEGLYTRVKRGGIPIQDVGIIADVRSGRVRVVANIASVEGEDVVLVDGARLQPDVILLATGYRQGLESFLGHLGVLDDRGMPRTHGAQELPGLRGLWFTGYTNPISGMFRELAIDARRIARAIARRG